MKFRAGKRLRRNSDIGAEFILSGIPRLEKLGKRIIECGASLEVNLYDGKPKIHARRCGSFFCGFCNSIQFLGVSERLEQIDFQDGNCYRSFSVTVPRVEIKEMKKTLNSMALSWKKFSGSKYFKHINGFYKKLEFEKKFSTVNPHFHVLVSHPVMDLTLNKRFINRMEKEIDFTTFSPRDWNLHYFFLSQGFYYVKTFSLILKFFGFGQITWIREPLSKGDHEKCKKELTKYITKNVHLEGQDLIDLWEQTLGVNKFSFGGRFRKFKKTFVYDSEGEKAGLIERIGTPETFAKHTYENPNVDNLKFLEFLIEHQFVSEVNN
ncbi:MAG: protein rep [Candidatus Nitronauta litoralis]|uniref:Protein rep n=1 Tax=Candidatus Nitronauta litoralis TaxID=2705533 RepID=A0A7T0BXU8_9BACT|nr:MAG: protein rep [Candidatus Nitronauta litoralis]